MRELNEPELQDVSGGVHITPTNTDPFMPADPPPSTGPTFPIPEPGPDY